MNKKTINLLAEMLYSKNRQVEELTKELQAEKIKYESMYLDFASEVKAKGKQIEKLERELSLMLLDNQHVVGVKEVCE